MERIVAAVVGKIAAETGEARIAERNFLNPPPPPVQTGGLTLYSDLQCLDEADIDRVLSEAAMATPRFLVLIYERYSAHVNEDGRNRHRTVRSRDWWLERLRAHGMDGEVVRQVYHDYVLISSFRLSPATHRQIQKVFRRERNRASIAKLPMKLFRPILARTTRYQTFDDIRTMTEGKRIALVGNARRLSDFAFGAEIDAHDIVIRINRCPIIDYRSHGRKTDWIAVGAPLPKEVALERGARVMLWMSERRYRIPGWIFRWPKIYMNPIRNYEALGEKMGMPKPTTGLMVFDLLQMAGNYEALDLYGFDFFKSLSTSGHRGVEEVPHDFSLEQAYVEKHIAEDGRIRLRW